MRKTNSGMLGVFLVAAELSRRGFTVSPTSRNARVADLLVTDQDCRRAFSVQVKTNAKRGSFWLINRQSDQMRSRSHIYVFVNLMGDHPPEYHVVPSRIVAERMKVNPTRKGSVFYEFHKRTSPECEGNWKAFDGDPSDEGA
jgi:hypothetical protein